MKTRSRMNAVLSIIFAVIVVIGNCYTSNAATVPYLNGWTLLDSGRHLDYDGDSIYMSNYTVGTTRWNNYKSGVIREDTAWIIEDVYVSDTTSSAQWKGKTFPNGYTTFNISQMQNLASYKQTNVAAHEIGHALGIGHGNYGDLMYEVSSSYNYTVPLSQNDKLSYDYVYATTY